ncbi:MAG TPA: GNAT family N-acetyltransferase [Nocardioidaceae bacterium]|nr:GNAT family N-acetyltransferase [Nocardioidaceae bacterium]
MPELVPPVARVRASFVDAVAQFRAEGQSSFAGTSTLPPVDDHPGEFWSEEELADPAVFERFVARLVAFADPATELPHGYVHNTQLWWVADDDYLGRLSIRHELTEPLLTWGGHIGYAVKPTARRQGHATAMLASALPIAHGLGIDPVLVTCDTDHVASRRVIESAGGRYEDTRQGKLRYWVPTG